MTGPTDRVVVVGAGFAGLAAALTLAAAGREVTLLERAERPGGCAGVLRRGGYTFDTGPSVITMPELFTGLLAALGERIEGRLALHRLDPVYRMTFADGSELRISTDVEDTAGSIESLAGTAEAAGYRRLTRWLQRLWYAERDAFIDRNFDSVPSLLGRDLAAVVALGGLRSLDRAVGRFLRDERVRRAFTFQSLYAGASPYRVRAAYAVIAYLDCVAGAVFPTGGVHRLAEVLADVAAEHGVHVRYGADVTRVERRGDRARAVLTADGERIPADVVVLAVDLPRACNELLGARPRRVRRLRSSPSAVVLHAGSQARYPDLAHHNVHFGGAWKRTFTELIDDRALMSDPSVLIGNPTRTDPRLAPPGRESYYVLAPAPNLTGRTDWSSTGPRYRDELVEHLESIGYPGFGAGIEVEALVTPADWARAGHTDGTPFAAAHTLAQTGPFRPGNLFPGATNVVFAGAWTRPGVGVPMALISGRLAAARIVGAGAAGGIVGAGAGAGGLGGRAASSVVGG